MNISLIWNVRTCKSDMEDTGNIHKEGLKTRSYHESQNKSTYIDMNIMHKIGH